MTHIFRFIGAGLCILVGFVALTVILVMPSPMIFADPVVRMVYIGFTAFLIIIAAGAFMVMLMILERR